MNARRYVGIAAAVGLVLVLALFLALAPTAPAAAQNTACYRPVGGASFECGAGGTFVVKSGGALDIQAGATMTVDGWTASTVDDLTVSDDAVIGGNATITGTSTLVGNVDVTGNLEVVDHIGNSGQEYWFPGDAVTVLSGGTITPTTALVELTAAGAVGTSLGTCTEGQVVMFVNTANQTITITDTGTTKLAGDWAGAQTDTLTLSCVGVSWYEMARSNN